MEHIFNNDIGIVSDMIQIVSVTHLESKWKIDALHYLKDQVNGLKDVWFTLKINLFLFDTPTIGKNVKFLVDTILLSASETSFTGPGGKNILNDQPNLAPGVKNTLETKFEQNPILEQKVKEKQKEKPENRICLKIAKVRSGWALREGQERATILYEELDVNSSTIIAVSRPLPNDIAVALLGRSRIRRTGIHLETLSPEGVYISPENQSWLVNGVWNNGVVCSAIRHPDIKFVDEIGMDIPYNGDKMLVPHGNRRRER